MDRLLKPDKLKVLPEEPDASDATKTFDHFAIT